LEGALVPHDEKLEEAPEADPVPDD
jgi:hypothetical protein